MKSSLNYMLRKRLSCFLFAASASLLAKGSSLSLAFRPSSSFNHAEETKLGREEEEEAEEEGKLSPPVAVAAAAAAPSVPSQVSSRRKEGVVVKWNDSSGFGFVRSGNVDYFCHFRSVQNSVMRGMLGVGAHVTFFSKESTTRDGTFEGKCFGTQVTGPRDEFKSGTVRVGTILNYNGRLCNGTIADDSSGFKFPFSDSRGFEAGQKIEFHVSKHLLVGGMLKPMAVLLGPQKHRITDDDIDLLSVTKDDISE